MAEASMKPSIPITDPRFNYIPAVRTDVRETWKRAKEEQAKKKEKGNDDKGR